MLLFTMATLCDAMLCYVTLWPTAMLSYPINADSGRLVRASSDSEGSRPKPSSLLLFNSSNPLPRLKPFPGKLTRHTDTR